jgi:hypothetical protein
LLGYLNLKSIKSIVECTFYDVMLASEATAGRMKGKGRAIVNIASMYGLVSPHPQTDDDHRTSTTRPLTVQQREPALIHTLCGLPMANGRNPHLAGLRTSAFIPLIRPEPMGTPNNPSAKFSAWSRRARAGASS